VYQHSEQQWYIISNEIIVTNFKKTNITHTKCIDNKSYF